MALKQYLLLGFEGVSISVLQKSLGIGRATLYYYYKSKDELFKDVINTYFFDIVLNEHKKIDLLTITIPELIEIFTN